MARAALRTPPQTQASWVARASAFGSGIMGVYTRNILMSSLSCISSLLVVWLGWRFALSQSLSCCWRAPRFVGLQVRIRQAQQRNRHATSIAPAYHVTEYV